MKNIILVLVIIFGWHLSNAQLSSDYDQYIEDELIDYSLILRYRDSIKLDEKQLASIQAFYKENNFDFQKSSTSYGEGMERLKRWIEEGKPRSEVLVIFSEILALESDIKRNKLDFLLHSREVLTKAQRNQLRLIGRGNQLTLKSNDDSYFGRYFVSIKPIYKVIDRTGEETFVKEALLSRINVDQIKTIDVQKGVDVNLDGFQLLNQNLITIRTDQKIKPENLKINLRGESSIVSSAMQPLIVVKLRGKTSVLGNIGDKEKRSMADIDPDEINSIEVIKGAKAIELYGMKGEGGVVIISLKNKAKYKIQ